MFSEACVSHFVLGGGGFPSGGRPPLDRDPPPMATAVDGKQPIGMHSSCANKTSTVVADKKCENTINQSSQNFCFVQFR